jgi:hypothetical protein
MGDYNMTLTSTPAFAQGIIAEGIQIYPENSTILKTVYTAGANGALIDMIHVGSSDTTSRDLQFFLASTSGNLARNTLTSNGTNVSNNDTVTIGTKTYTFQTTLTNVDGNVKIGSTAALSLTNLVNAITCLSGVPGTDYAFATTEHPTVTAASPTSTTILVMANTIGTSGNSIGTTKSATTLTWTTATLAEGADNVYSSFLLGTVNIPANTGFTNSVSLLSILDNVRFGGSAAPTGWQVVDSNGNKLLRLKANESIRVRSLAAVTSAKTIWVRVSGVTL